jgi:hypothetical protein
MRLVFEPNDHVCIEDIPRISSLTMSKVLITIPDDLLEHIDRAARARKTTRSRFIQDAALHELGWPEPGVLDAALARARDALASTGPFESADLIRRDREARDAGRA